MARTCSKLGTRLLYARPYSPESTGKVERFNRTFDEFLQEVRLEKPQTVDELNSWADIWMRERYTHKEHSALNGKTPFEAFRNESTQIRSVSAEELAHAFLHAETRKVDKSGCISFQDRKYEVGLNFVGCKVEITFDPQDTQELIVDYPGYESWKAREMVITEKTGKWPSLPEKMTKEPARGQESERGPKGIRRYTERTRRELPQYRKGRCGACLKRSST